MDEDASANGLALSQGRDHEIGCILDRRELRADVRGDPVVVGDDPMHREALAHRPEHVAVKVDDAILAIEREGPQLADHVIGVVGTEAFELRVAEGARVVVERLALLEAGAQPGSGLRHPDVSRPGGGLEMGTLPSRRQYRTKNFTVVNSPLRRGLNRKSGLSRVA